MGKKKRKELGKSPRKFRGISRKLGEGFLWIFPGFSDIGVNSGMAVMARRTGRWDHGVRGIPGVVADRGAGVTRDGRRPERSGAGGIRGTRAEGKRIDRGFEKGLDELSGKVLKTRAIY
jgi:hypothetical protein